MIQWSSNSLHYSVLIKRNVLFIPSPVQSKCLSHSSKICWGFVVCTLRAPCTHPFLGSVLQCTVITVFHVFLWSGAQTTSYLALHSQHLLDSKKTLSEIVTYHRMKRGLSIQSRSAFSERTHSQGAMIFRLTWKYTVKHHGDHIFPMNRALKLIRDSERIKHLTVGAWENEGGWESLSKSDLLKLINMF